MPIDINALPKDIKLHILSFFQPNQLSSIARVSKSWYQLTNDNKIWKDFLKNSHYFIPNECKHLFFHNPGYRKEFYLTCNDVGIDWMIRKDFEGIDLGENIDSETRKIIRNRLSCKSIQYFLKKRELILTEVKQLTQDFIEFLRFPSIETLIIANKMSLSQARSFSLKPDGIMNLYNTIVCKYIIKDLLTYEQAFCLETIELALLKVDYIQELLDSGQLKMEEFLSLKDSCPSDKYGSPLLKLAHKSVHQLHKHNKISLIDACKLDFTTLVKLKRYPELIDLICSEKISLEEALKLTDEMIISLRNSQVEERTLSMKR